MNKKINNTIIYPVQQDRQDLVDVPMMRYSAGSELLMD